MDTKLYYAQLKTNGRSPDNSKVFVFSDIEVAIARLDCDLYRVTVFFYEKGVVVNTDVYYGFKVGKKVYLSTKEELPSETNKVAVLERLESGHKRIVSRNIGGLGFVEIILTGKKLKLPLGDQ